MVERLPPSTQLAPYVDCYSYRVVDLADAQKVILSPARIAQFVEFYLGDPYTVQDLVTGKIFQPPLSTVVGIQAIGPIQLIMSGKIRNFTIKFRPSAFHELFRIPMNPLSGTSDDFDSIFKSTLREQLGDCQNFQQAVTAAESILIPLALRAQERSNHLTQWFQSTINKPTFVNSIDDWLKDAPVGSRQVQRAFQTHVGVSPKRFWKVLRFQTAVNLSRQAAYENWGDISAELGYHDQMHLVHDFQELAGEAPTRLVPKLSDSY